MSFSNMRLYLIIMLAISTKHKVQNHRCLKYKTISEKSMDILFLPGLMRTSSGLHMSYSWKPRYPYLLATISWMALKLGEFRCVVASLSIRIKKCWRLLIRQNLLWYLVFWIYLINAICVWVYPVISNENNYCSHSFIRLSH